MQTTPSAQTTHFGFDQVPLAEKQGRVDAVFHAVAARYDRMNDVMSAGLHRVWKNALVDKLHPPRTGPYAHLDVAGGTGDVAFRIAERAKGASIDVVDINASMLAVGQERAQARGLGHICFLEDNAETLAELADNAYDSYTIAFGIRNVPRLDLALAQAYRVLKRGGRFLCLEFAPVDTPFIGPLYDAYSFNVIPRMGELVAGDRASYQYLVESIRQFPRPEAFCEKIAAAGFTRVGFSALTFGVANIHSGWKV